MSDFQSANLGSIPSSRNPLWILILRESDHKKAAGWGGQPKLNRVAPPYPAGFQAYKDSIQQNNILLNLESDTPQSKITQVVTGPR